MLFFRHFLEKTGCSLDLLPFKLYDFGYRGVSSEETAGIGGSAHLTSFMGTDNLAAIRLLQFYYNSEEPLENINKIYGFSVPASEHSVATAWGELEEDGYFLNMLKQYPTGIVSIVSDTYDVYNFVKTMAIRHKQKIFETGWCYCIQTR